MFIVGYSYFLFFCHLLNHFKVSTIIMNLSTSSFTFVKHFFWFILWSNCTSCMHTCYLFLPASHTCHYLRCLLISVRFLSEATMGRGVLSTSGPKLEGWALPLNLNLTLWLKEFWEFWKVWGRGFFFFFKWDICGQGWAVREAGASSSAHTCPCVLPFPARSEAHFLYPWTRLAEWVCLLTFFHVAGMFKAVNFLLRRSLVLRLSDSLH